MNIGEKIKICRKANKMSQEELGQQLMVSRQTISLWETGQALPTIDNLVRLKEIFKMSLDSILCDGEEGEREALESYSFTIAPLDLARIQGSMFKRQNDPPKHILIGSVLLMIPVLAGGYSGFAAGMLTTLILLCSAVLLKNRKIQKKTVKEYYKRGESILEYSFFEDHLVYEAFKNAELRQTTKIYYTDIDKIYCVGDYLAISHRGILYLMKTAEIPETSRIYSLSPRDTSLSPAAFEAGRRNLLSIYLILFSIASIFIALAAIGSVADATGEFLRYTWIFYLFTPIPLSLVGYGIYLKKKKYSGALNIIIGVIVCLVLVLYGSFCFLL